MSQAGVWGTVTPASRKKNTEKHLLVVVLLLLHVVRALHIKGEAKFKVTLFHCETFISVTTSEFVSFGNCFIDTLFMGDFLKWQLFANLLDCLVVPRK